MKWLKQFWQWLIAFLGIIGTVFGMLAIFIFSGRKRFNNGLDSLNEIEERRKENEKIITDSTIDDYDEHGNYKPRKRTSRRNK